MSKEGPRSGRLDHYPLIGHYLKRLGVREAIDRLVPVDPRSKVTTGECVEVLAAVILGGRHTLYRASDFLQPFDLTVAFGADRSLEPRFFNDERLAKALDDLFCEGGVAKINCELTLRAIKEFELSLERIHTDTTTISVHGEYEGSQEPKDPEANDAVPHVTRGYSKDRRPDLKQVLYGLSVSGDGAVPVFGRVSSGNRGDPREIRYLLEQVRDALPHPEETLYVADSKLFAGESLSLLAGNDLRFVTLMPRSVGLWKQAYQRFLGEEGRAPVLKRKQPEAEGGSVHEWRGRSYDLTYEFDFDESHHRIPLRLVVVESEALRSRKQGVIERRQLKERATLDKLAKKYEPRTFSCGPTPRRSESAC